MSNVVNGRRRTRNLQQQSRDLTGSSCVVQVTAEVIPCTPPVAPGVLACFANDVAIQEPRTDASGCDVNSAATETQTQLQDPNSALGQSAGDVGEIEVILATEQPSSQPSGVPSEVPSLSPSKSSSPSLSSQPSDAPITSSAPSASIEPSSPPSVSMEPSSMPNTEFNCVDDSAFEIVRGKGRKQVRRPGCEWLSRKPNRCRKSKRSAEFFAKCPTSCKERVCICKDRKSKFSFTNNRITRRGRCRKLRQRLCNNHEVRMQCPIKCEVERCVL